MPALFLDRDGVINQRYPGDYVKTPEDFIFMPGVESAISRLNKIFYPIVVVTNQAGIGKDLMRVDDIHQVHQKMHVDLSKSDAKIHAVYFCPHRSDAGCTCRKPNTGMGWLALADFPEIDFETAWLVGDSASDIEFGKRLGMHTALIAGKHEDAAALVMVSVDFKGNSLTEFADFMEKITSSRLLNPHLSQS